MGKKNISRSITAELCKPNLKVEVKDVGYHVNFAKMDAKLKTERGSCLQVMSVGDCTFIAVGRDGTKFLFDKATGKSMRSDTKIVGIWVEYTTPGITNQKLTDKRKVCRHTNYINLSLTEEPWLVCEECGLDHPDNYKQSPGVNKLDQ